MNIKIFLAVFLVFPCVFSCSAEREQVPIDISAGEDIVIGERWALIDEPYAAYRVKPSFSAKVSTYGRRGDTVKVEGTFIDMGESAGAQRTVWYRFAAGWLPEQNVIIYSNKLKAEFAAGKIK